MLNAENVADWILYSLSTPSHVNVSLRGFYENMKEIA